VRAGGTKHRRSTHALRALALVAATACGWRCASHAAAPSVSSGAPPVGPSGAASFAPAVEHDAGGPDLPDEWPAIAPPGFVLADRHWTSDGELWLLLRSEPPDGRVPLRICALRADRDVSVSLREARCADAPPTVPRFASADADFALDDEPIVVGSTPAGRAGFSARTGAPIAVRGMPGRESHTGLAVERVGPRQYKVLAMKGGKPVRSAPLRVPFVDGFSDNRDEAPVPVVVGDEVGWLERGFSWMFAKLTPNGLAPRMVGHLSGYFIGWCRADSGWIVLLGGTVESIIFGRNGRWSRPIPADMDLMEAGPTYMGLVCRDGVAVDTVALDGITKTDEDCILEHREGCVLHEDRRRWDLEERRCTRRGCENPSVSYEADKPYAHVLIANLAAPDRERTVLAWHDREGALRVKSAPFVELPAAAERRYAMPRGMRLVTAPSNENTYRDVVVRDGVALVIFAHRGLHLARFDVDGNVAPVSVADREAR
jgi:hypothetical protein